MKSTTGTWHTFLLPVGLILFLALVEPRTALGIPDSTSTKTTTKAGQSTVLRFPARSVGKLYTMSTSARDFDLPSVGAFYAAAQGAVKVMAGTKLLFEPNTMIFEQPNLLNEFPAETLNYVDLRNLEITDPLVTALGKLHLLKDLSMEDTDLTDERMKDLGGLANLRFLNLSKNLLKGPGLRYLTGAKDLKRLDLGYDIVNRDPGQYLSQFPKLGCLLMCHCCLKDSDLPGLAKIKTLEHLKISCTLDITDNGMKALTPLKRLRILEVDETRVTADGLLVLKGAPLETIYLNSRWNTREKTTMLHKAFPKAVLHFNGIRKDVPLEIFSPLH